jgi:hypothetical protein
MLTFLCTIDGPMTLVITVLACLVGFMILGLYASLTASVYHFRRDCAGPGEPLLPMTLIKPVRGLDDGMRENFEAIADSDPEKALQVIIALESEADPAAAVAQGFAASHPGRDILVLYTGTARGRTGKAHNMIEALSRAKHARVIFSDADIRTTPGLLRGTSQAFRNGYEAVFGLPYHVYVPDLGGWMFRVAFNHNFSVAAPLTYYLGLFHFASGAWMAYTREVLEREAALHARADDRAEAWRQTGEERRGIGRAEERPREEDLQGRTEAPGVEMAPPIRQLLRRSFEVEECAQPRRPPPGERQERAPERHEPLGGAANHGPPRDAPRRVGELGGIQVHCHDVVTRREPERSAPRRGDAEDASARPERRELDRRVLVHAAEENLLRPGTAVKAPVCPDGLVGDDAHEAPRARAAATQTRTRNAKFLTTMPPGSWMMWRAQMRPLAFRVTRSSVCVSAHGPGAIPLRTQAPRPISPTPSVLRKSAPTRGPKYGTASTIWSWRRSRPRTLHHNPS